MLLKESFFKIYDCKTAEEAENYLIAWIKETIESFIETFKLIALSFKEKM